MDTGWLAEIDPATSPPFVRMGTRALGADAWLLGGGDVPAQLAEKHRILAAHHDEVVAAIDGTEDAAAELLDAIGRQLGAPSALSDPPHPTPGAGVLGTPSPAATSPVHPIDAAGRLVAEDLCLLVLRAGRWVLGAGSVCFPSHWRLTDKLGAPMAVVHGPVPDYATDLADRVDRFLDKLRAGRGVRRRNWTVHTRPDLFAPERPPPPDPPITAGDAGQRLWLRSERQTLTRLPQSGAIVFTIRTQQTPLAAVATHPDLRTRLAQAIAARPPHQTAYRGGEALRQPLLAWLTRDQPL
jgi:dimethylamine monooxygenase subunit A